MYLCIYVSMYRSMYRSIYLSIYLSIYPSTPFWIFFARNMSTPGFLSKTTRGWRKQKRKGAWPESESSCGVANQKTFQKGGPWENNVFCFFFKIRCLMWFVFFFLTCHFLCHWCSIHLNHVDFNLDSLQMIKETKVYTCIMLDVLPYSWKHQNIPKQWA